MTVTILDSAPPVSDEELALVEQRMGRAIPAAYREFLLTHNGGYPTPEAFIIWDRDGKPLGEGGIHYFLSSRAGASDDLEDYVRTYQDRVPPHFFPIADDPSGNILCLSTAGDDEGKVYFWDHEAEAGEDETTGYDNVYFVADSFEALLDNLREPR